MRILITGASGFIGRNLLVRLRELKRFEVTTLTREDEASVLAERVRNADAVVHLAGVNRPEDPREFSTGNAGFTAELGSALSVQGTSVPVIFASSTQAELENPYGRSKCEAEAVLAEYARSTGAAVFNFRLPNVFGKWCRPNYNSAVATFCYNISRDLPVRINDPDVRMRLVYIDDVVEAFIRIIDAGTFPVGFQQCSVPTEYSMTVGDLAELLRAFHQSRQSLVTERVGNGVIRALYATYVSYLPTTAFAYPVPRHGDARGVFVEMLKTPDSGQFSFFTAHPGITRGGHYHHSKTEKFLVIQGEARFRFRNIVTEERHELFTSGAAPEIVETVPGWTHDITNVGDREMVVMLWANEIFDRRRPDTVACEVWG